AGEAAARAATAGGAARDDRAHRWWWTGGRAARRWSFWGAWGRAGKFPSSAARAPGTRPSPGVAAHRSRAAGQHRSTASSVGRQVMVAPNLGQSKSQGVKSMEMTQGGRSYGGGGDSAEDNSNSGMGPTGSSRSYPKSAGSTPASTQNAPFNPQKVAVTD